MSPDRLISPNTTQSCGRATSSAEDTSAAAAVPALVRAGAGNVAVDTPAAFAASIAGPAAAVQATRDAFEAGQIDALDVPEVYLALQARSGGFFDELSTHAPGGSRFPFAPA